eukprot:TRINITY_DN26960_c0_g1_i1.p2 TRINITY_DN26960_c0_g1~~TRINITY_DN26960_c0_g1_i1.p2  ORF type:complete len:106 (+),score=18.84 TRINITY_DN26960_c0_g1_i1:251-568(+)
MQRRRRSESMSMLGRDLASCIHISRSPWRITTLSDGSTEISSISISMVLDFDFDFDWVSVSASGGGGGRVEERDIDRSEVGVYSLTLERRRGRCTSGEDKHFSFA